MKDHIANTSAAGTDAVPRVRERNAEPPRLVVGVRLHGQMPDVGYTTTQWLIERNQQFLQTSELLYRVVEQIDGSRNTRQIAEAVTEQSNWALEAEHVQHLIDKKLRPLGLVVISEIDAPQPISSKVESRFPVRLMMRMRMLPPRFVERFTTVLQYAYAPALLLPLVLLIAVAHWWLYALSGIQRGIESTLYQPGALGAVLALAVAAGLFHELGHASALRYGGGQPRGIGFGLYMMLPAFYSDVTDSYRLSRAARIRTDLGGIYFHLIFAAGLIGVSAWTGNEFVLAAAVLFNIEALRQFIPFVRLDGYWLLADLTGVPDFTSQIGSFVRSLRPNRKYSTALPQFKRWVTAVFGVYLILSIPATVYVIALIVMYVPELAALTQKALLVQTTLWSTTEDPSRLVLIALQIALVPLPLAATLYFLYMTFSSAADQIFRRLGGGAPAIQVRRLAGATALAGAAAFAAAAWAPAMPAGSGALAASLLAANPTDPRALLQSATAAMARVQTLEAAIAGTFGDETISGTIALSRPNRAHVVVRGAADSLGSFSVISDGQKVIVFFPQDNQFTQVNAAADGANINAFIIEQVRAFFKPDRLAPKADQQLSYVGNEQVAGSEFDVVELSGSDGNSWRYYISSVDNLVHTIVSTTVYGGRTSTRTVHLQNVRINGDVDREQFRWSPPAGATRLGLEILGGALPLKSTPD